MVWISHFWNDESGTIVSAEIILVITIAGIGMIAGLTTYRDAAVMEMADLATAIGQFNQSYSLSSVILSTTIAGTVYNASIAGSTFNDDPDWCQDTTSSTTDPTNAGTACVAIVAASAE